MTQGLAPRIKTNRELTMTSSTRTRRAMPSSTTTWRGAMAAPSPGRQAAPRAGGGGGRARRVRARLQEAAAVLVVGELEDAAHCGGLLHRAHLTAAAHQLLREPRLGAAVAPLAAGAA